MQVVVDDLLTNCELSGKGSLILMLHGWGDSIKGFQSLQNHLSKNHQVLAIDLPGFGNTEPPKTVWNLDNYAHFVAAVLKKLDVPEPDIIIGHSNGGAIAIRACALKVLTPKRLILIASAGIRTKHSARRLAFQVLAKTGNVATVWMPERYREALRKSLYGAARSDLLVMPQLQETFKKTVRQDIQEDAKHVTIPTLLIYAKNDDSTPLSYGEQFVSLMPNAKLAVVADGGHFVHINQPDTVQKLIEEYIS